MFCTYVIEKLVKIVTKNVLHTSDIEHAIHRYDLHGRTFQLIEGDNNHKGFFEVV